MKPTRLIFLVLLAAVAIARAFAQDPVVNLQQGYKPYDSYHGGDFDAVSITNGNLNLSIPLLSYPQRGGALELAWKIAYSNRSWAAEQYEVSQSPVTYVTWWQWHGQGVQPVLTKQYGQNNFMFVVPPPSGDAGDRVHAYTLYEADGSAHPLDMRSGINGGLQYATDASGLKANAGTGFYVIDSKGVKYTATNWTDANGNQITLNSSTITDTMGRNIPASITADSGWSFLPAPWAFFTPTGGYQQINGQTAAPGTVVSTAGCPSGSVSARQWTVPTYGGNANYIFCYAQYSLSTQFGAYGTSEGSSSVRFINAVILPNQTSWTFSYSSWGDLTRVGLPTGGSISYQWGTTGACYTGGSPATGLVRYVTSRTVNDGTNSHTWTYTRNGTTQTIVTDPDGNDTVYAHDCAFVSQVDTYQGSHSTGTLLKTVKTTYDLLP